MTAATRSVRAPTVCYAVAVHSLHAHLFAITVTITRPAARQVVSLPTWIAGSYLLREFSKHLQGLQARQDGKALTVQQLDKCTWQIDCQPGKTLALSYMVYALDASVRTAWLDTERGFFNGTSVCLKVHGQEGRPHRLQVINDGLPADWQMACSLRAETTAANGFGSYVAGDYDELVDSPVELGAFWSGSFAAGGIVHRLVVAGAPASFDGERLLKDTQAICETEISFWHGHGRRTRRSKPGHDRYVFMLSATDNGYGGLEHRHSTALICKRSDLPKRDQATDLAATDGYTTLLGLISHEYFHTWSVKRLRPAEFASYDYSRENYTELLWFFEGFTSYYDDLLLRRAGLIDDATYLNLLAKTIHQVLQTPGRQLQSVAQASFDAWIKYYRPDENTVNATVSYYTKGALVALCLDLSLRQSGRTSLDAVMRELWSRCQGGPMTEADLLATLQALSGQSFAAQLTDWVHGTDDLPVQPLLQSLGIAYTEEKALWADQLGLRVSEQGGIRIKSVLRDSVAEQAGFAAGDEWLGIEVGQGHPAQGWRMNKLDDLALYLGDQQNFTALVARDQRLCHLKVKLTLTAKLVKLGVNDLALATPWLAGTAV
ncbi:MAG: M61 family metallopeptidase [Rhodoferax sp.]|uniref:M61 family metallopeptidase n=1 Tax=Rhodoferax sp. TaxID=50421 RepID=UPI001B63813E|nr:peptidase M61 [Rhodoferax sp.]MBP9906138.1 M61 family metallopeptidase [Rhodoferax sp.]